MCIDHALPVKFILDKWHIHSFGEIIDFDFFNRLRHIYGDQTTTKTNNVEIKGDKIKNTTTKQKILEIPPLKLNVFVWVDWGETMPIIVLVVHIWSEHFDSSWGQNTHTHTHTNTIRLYNRRRRRRRRTTTSKKKQSQKVNKIPSAKELAFHVPANRHTKRSKIIHFEMQKKKINKITTTTTKFKDYSWSHSNGSVNNIVPSVKSRVCVCVFIAYGEFFLWLVFNANVSHPVTTTTTTTKCDYEKGILTFNLLRVYSTLQVSSPVSLSLIYM